MAACKCGNEDKSLPNYKNWECWQCLYERFGKLSISEMMILRNEINGMIVKTEMEIALRNSEVKKI